MSTVRSSQESYDDMHYPHRHISSANFGKNDHEPPISWSLFNEASDGISRDGLIQNTTVDNGNLFGTHYSQQPCIVLDRFANEFNEAPVNTCNAMMEPQRIHSDVDELNIPPHHWTFAGSMPSARDYYSGDRLASPDETIFSSASGSAYHPESTFDVTPNYDARYAWHHQSEGSQYYPSPYDTPQTSDYEVFSGSGIGITLQEVQPYPDLSREHPYMHTGALEIKTELVDDLDDCETHQYRQRFDSRLSPPSDDDSANLEIGPVHCSQDDDSDYLPSRPRTARKSGLQRDSLGRRDAAKPSSKVSKRGTRHGRQTSRSYGSPILSKSEPHIHPPNPTGEGEARPFVCPLAPYGCTADFTAKNEWKRHVTSQHILTGFWRCNMCPESSKGPNDFNRKDLFIQHIRRMHSGSRSGAKVPMTTSKSRRSVAKSKDKLKRAQDNTTATGDKNLEDNLKKIELECWTQIRKPPMELQCAFCHTIFTGDGCTEEWLEHVGRHLSLKSSLPGVEDRKHARTDSKSDVWAQDQLLMQWLLDEDLIEPVDDQEGRYVLADKAAVSAAALEKSQSNGQKHSSVEEV